MKKQLYRSFILSFRWCAIILQCTSLLATAGTTPRTRLYGIPTNPIIFNHHDIVCVTSWISSIWIYASTFAPAESHSIWTSPKFYTQPP